MNGEHGYARLERALAAHLRDPARYAPPPGLDKHRVAIHATLLLENLSALLGNCLPVLRSITPEPAWQALMRGFLARHRAQTPLFPRVPAEFLAYLVSEREVADDPPFLAELVEYEYLNVELACDPRELDLAGVDQAASLLDGIPVLNPIARLRAYRFPVHRMGRDCQPASADAEPNYLAIYRNRADQVCSLQLNAVSARLLELVATNGEESGRLLLQRIADELAHPRPAALIEAGRSLLAELARREVLLGARSVRLRAEAPRSPPP